MGFIFCHIQAEVNEILQLSCEWRSVDVSAVFKEFWPDEFREKESEGRPFSCN
jgi:hypothetical protein